MRSRARRTRTPSTASTSSCSTKAEATLETAASLGEALGVTPVLSVASELHFTPSGVLPYAEARSLAERTQDLVEAPVVAGLHSLAAGKLAHGLPDEDAFVCGDDAERSRPRGDDGGDRQPQQALQGPRRHPRHRSAVTQVVEISDPAERSRIVEAVLRDLPGWFGIEESTRQYIEDAATLPTFAVEPDLGVLCLRQHTPRAAEIYVAKNSTQRQRAASP